MAVETPNFSSEDAMRAFWKEQYEEEAREILDHDPLAQNIRYVKFKSYSKGKGRRKTSLPRQEVELVGDGDRFVQIKEGDVQGQIDEWAKWYMPDSPDGDEYQQFLERVRSQEQ